MSRGSSASSLPDATSLTSGSFDTAIGSNALALNKGGSMNTAVGRLALGAMVEGVGNIAVGDSAGFSYAGMEGNNIAIGNLGVPGENDAIRIGQSQLTTFIAGISGATSASGIPVLVNPSGQLGTTTSSLRFKEEVADMGEASDSLMRLRPVTFRYKAAYDDGSHLLQYGLIAEEVAKVYPDLVQYDQEGRPQAVRYHFVDAMLLNEVQQARGHATLLRSWLPNTA